MRTGMNSVLTGTVSVPNATTKEDRMIFYRKLADRGVYMASYLLGLVWFCVFGISRMYFVNFFSLNDFSGNIVF